MLELPACTPPSSLPVRLLQLLPVPHCLPQAAGSEQEGAFAATRYLSGLLAIARKHGMLPEGGQSLSAAAGAAAAADDEQQQQQQQPEASSSNSSSSSLEVVAAPERGNVLIAHPALNGIFGRSVVLLCSHEPHQGSYG